MKKKWMITYLLIYCLLCGCASQKAEELISGVMVSEITFNDFTFILTAEKVVYTEKEAGEENPFSYKLEMEYTGEERIRLWHARQIGTIAVWNAEEDFYSKDIEGELMSSYLEKNDRIIIAEWTGELVSEEQELVSGIYTVTGYIDFQVGEEHEDVNHLKDNEYIDCSLSLPLVIQ